MKPLSTLVLICFLWSAALQASEALLCFECSGWPCIPQITACPSDADHCYSTKTDIMGLEASEKGCATKMKCAVEIVGKTSCCDWSLCNGAEGVKLSLLIMLGPLLSSILFL